MTSLCAALAALDAAKDRVFEAMVQDLPAGTVVQWPHGKDYRIGTVRDHTSGGLRVLVSGISSRFWIYASRITHRRLPGESWERMDGAAQDPPPSESGRVSR